MNEILKLHIDKLDLPDQLKDVFIRAGFKNLKQILDRTTAFLLNLDGFKYRELKTFVEFLEKNNIDQLLKDD
jgi:hypothetical protein